MYRKKTARGIPSKTKQEVDYLFKIMAASEEGPPKVYSLIYDNEHKEHADLLDSFITELHVRTAEWGFTCSDTTLVSWFEQLQNNLNNTSVMIVVILPDHDETKHKANYATQTALLKAIQNRDKLVIPICLMGGKSEHFAIYNNLEFNNENDIKNNDKLWGTLHKALEDGCLPATEIEPRLPDMSLEEWLQLYNDDKEDGAKKLLEYNVILDKATMQRICRELGRKSDAVKAACKHISNMFKDRGAERAYATYKYECKDDIEYVVVFVVISNYDIEEAKDYVCYYRKPEELDPKCKEENRLIRQREMNDRYNVHMIEEIDAVKRSIELHGETFMADHSNCVRITASLIKSEGHNLDNHIMKKQQCIAVYVHVKGLIPLHEDPFPTKMGEFNIDVREGVVVLAM